MSILTEADGLINGPRASTYGDAIDNFTNIADLWNWWMRKKQERLKVHVEIEAEDVAVMMALLKLARLSTSPDHRDSIVDTAGYLGTLEHVLTKRKERAQEERTKSEVAAQASASVSSCGCSICQSIQ